MESHLHSCPKRSIPCGYKSIGCEFFVSIGVYTVIVSEARFKHGCVGETCKLH